MIGAGHVFQGRVRTLPDDRARVARIRGAVADLDALAVGRCQPSDLDALARRLETLADEMARAGR